MYSTKQSLPKLKDYSKIRNDKLKNFFKTERSTSEPQQPNDLSQMKIRDFLSKNTIRLEDRKTLETLINRKEKIIDIYIEKSSQKVLQKPKIKFSPLKQQQLLYFPIQQKKQPKRQVTPEYTQQNESQEENSSSEEEDSGEDSEEDQYKIYKTQGLEKAIKSVQRKLMPANQSYFDFIKKKDKLKDFITNFRHRDTQNPVYFYCMNDDLFPKRIDLSNCLVATKEMNFSDMGVSTLYYPIIQKLLQSKKSQQVKQIILCNNKLNDFAFSLLIPNFAITLKDLNLMNNELGRRGIEVLGAHMHRFTNLKHLNLCNNQLGDQGAIELLSYLQRNSVLTKLNLAENDLTDLCSKALFQMLVMNSSLEILILNWNRLGALTGLQLAKALLKNTTLKVLDISYNKLGSNPNCIGAWCEAVQSASIPIIHLDLSFNQFNESQLKKLDESLRKNNRIYGLHIEGNKCPCYVDPYGFIVFPNDNEELKQIESRKQKINGVNYIPSADPMIGNDCCWICQGWMEFKFTYIPDANAPQVPIFLHLDFLNYKPIPMTTSAELRQQFLEQKKQQSNLEITTGEIIHQLKQITNSDKKISMAAIQEAYNQEVKQDDLIVMDDLSKFYYTTYQMCPPRRRIFYFFSNPIREEYFIDPSVISMQSPLDDLILAGKDPKHQVHLFQDGTMLPFKRVTHVNYLLSRQEFVIDDKNNYKPLVKVFPRSSEKKYVLRRFANNQIRKKINLINWNVDESIFRQFQGDTEQLVNECFEFDWSCSKITRFVRSDYEKIKLKEYFKDTYILMKDVYKYYAALGYQSTQEIFCIQFVTFNKLISQMNIIDSELLKQQDVEIDLVSIKNNTDQRFIYNPDKALVRYQFMEMFFRLANDKFIRTNVCKNYADAAFRILKEFKAFFADFDCSQEWRATRLWTKECDYQLQFKQVFLKRIYDYVTDISNRKWYFKLKWISIKEFKEFCRQMGFVEILGEKQMVIIFNQSMMTQVDELTQDRNIRMSFIEFIEALARLAERISPCPLGDQVESWTLLDRQLLPLHIKLESLLSYIYHKLGFKNSEYEQFADMFSQDNAKDAMPKSQLKKMKDKEIINKLEEELNTNQLSLFNTLGFLKQHEQPYLNPNYRKFMNNPYSYSQESRKYIETSKTSERQSLKKIKYTQQQQLEQVNYTT